MDEITETGEAVRAADKETVLVYGHLNVPSLGYPKDTLSILVMTENGEVYGGGMNYTEGNSDDVNSYTKVWNLDGNVAKIAVGPEYGAAIDHAGRLMVWKHTNHSPVGAGDSIDFGVNHKNTPSIVCVKYNKEKYTFLCHKCFMPGTRKFYDTHPVVYCSSCKRYFGQSSDHQIMNMLHPERNPVRTIFRANDVRITDVALVGVKICMLLENNKMFLRNLLDNAEETIEYQLDENCSSDKVVAVYGEGGKEGRLFIKYKDGSLFKCSRHTSQQNSSYGYPAYVKGNNHVLSVIKLRAAVDKVCCGRDHTAVLLNDGSVWFIASESTTYRLVHNSGANVFTDVAVISSTNIFLVQVPAGKIRDGSSMNITLPNSTSDIIVEFYEPALDGVLKEMVHAKSRIPLFKESTGIPARTLPIQNLPLSTATAQLYGNPYLADMTIKLADEDLPAHTTVLFSSSAHFLKTFNADNPPPKVLDVSQYNPKAYRYLLQYFYQVQPDDLDVEDFVHLREIATSYGETALADAATAKIKSRLSEDNVENIFTLSKRLDFPDVAVECEKVMRSQPFVEKLLRKTMKNLSAQT